MSTTTRSPRQDPPGTGAVVHVDRIRKTYGDKVAVADVSFEVGEGEIFGILGPNGAGKTTAVETLAGLRKADGGALRVLGVDPQADPDAVREDLGIQLQESSLPARITVAEAADLYAAFYRDPADTDELIEMLGLAEHRDTRFEHLSGGQKQRLSIALALVGRPRVAILDELTTGLDPQARRDTWELVRRVRDTGVTILLVTHFMEEAERLCDRLVVIDAGRVVAEGSPAELTRDVAGSRSLRLRLPEDADPDEMVAVLRHLPEVEAAERHPSGDLDVSGTDRVLPATVAALAQRDVVPEQLHTSTRSLEDAFVDLISDPPEESS